MFSATPRALLGRERPHGRIEIGVSARADALPGSVPSFFSVPSITNFVMTTPIDPVSVDGSATMTCAGIAM